jgi:hypothetical protein
MNLEELKRKNAKLKAQAEVREDFERRNAEKKRILKENFLLRHYRTAGAIRGFLTRTKTTARQVSSGVSGIGSAIVKEGKLLRKYYVKIPVKKVKKIKHRKFKRKIPKGYMLVKRNPHNYFY